MFVFPAVFVYIRWKELNERRNVTKLGRLRVLKWVIPSACTARIPDAGTKQFLCWPFTLPVWWWWCCCFFFLFRASCMWVWLAYICVFQHLPHAVGFTFHKGSFLFLSPLIHDRKTLFLNEKAKDIVISLWNPNQLKYWDRKAHYLIGSCAACLLAMGSAELHWIIKGLYSRVSRADILYVTGPFPSSNRLQMEAQICKWVASLLFCEISSACLFLVYWRIFFSSGSKRKWCLKKMSRYLNRAKLYLPWYH